MASDPYGAIKFGEFRKYMQHKKAKLKDQEMELDDKSVPDSNRIFEGLSIYINGYTDPPQSELRKLIIQHGGNYQHYLVKSSVTHIVASNLTNSKMQEFRAYKIVKPSWITESIKAQKLLPWSQYRTVGTSSGQKELPFSAVPGPSAPTPAVVEAASSSSTAANNQPQNIRSSLKRSFDDMQKEDAETTRRINTPSPSPSPPASPQLRLPTRSRHASPSATTAHPRGEDLNAALLAKKWNRETTTLNPDFIKKYYKSSRLHHLSTWKAEMREIVRKMEQKYPDVSDPNASRKRKRTDGVRVIMHVDFDCFFASVGLIDRPELKDKPVAVSHSKGIREGSSSDIASCNYIARKYGISNGMQIGYAKRKCPSLQVIPYEFEKYKAVSEIFYEILFRYADQIQAVSVDEALIEVTSHITQLNSGQEDALAKKIRDEIRDKTKCEASIGIGPNILIARLATRKAKPCGQYHCKPENVNEILETTDVADLPGVGYSMSSKLGEMGVSKVGELRRLKLYELQQKFGEKTGSMLYNYARGLDNRPLVMDQPRQSVSAEVNWGVRFENNEQLEAFLKGLAEEVSDRLKKVEKQGKNITVKILRRKLDAGEAEKLLGCGVCDSFAKSVNLDDYTDDAQIIFQHTYRMLKSFGFPVADLRGIGIQIQKLNTDGDASPRRTQQTLRFSSSGGTAVKKLQTAPDQQQQQTEGQHTRKIKPPMTVNANVFDELPPEVQKELLDGYDVTFIGEEEESAGSTKHNTEGEADKDAPAKQQPAETKADAVSVQEPSITTATSLPLTSQPDIPPWSQLDPSALLALPDSMRNQLLEAYSKERRKTVSTAADNERRSVEPPAIPPPSVQTLRGSSVSPRNSKSRAKKLTGSSSSKPGITLTQMFPLSRQDGVHNDSRTNIARDGDREIPVTQSWDPNIWNELPPEMQRELLEDYRREKERKARTIRNEHFREARTKLMDTDVRLLNIKTFQDLEPKLMGRNSMDDIRDMLRQWVSAFPEGPEPEDMETVTSFILDLARIKNFEKAQLVVLSLEQIAKRDTTQSPWKEFASTLREKLCSAVGRLYQLQLRF